MNAYCRWLQVWVGVLVFGTLVGTAVPGVAGEEFELRSEDVLFAPRLGLSSEYEEHIQEILGQRQAICRTLQVARYPEVEDFFGIRLGTQEAVDAFYAKENQHYRQLFSADQVRLVESFARQVRRASRELRSEYPLHVEPMLQLKRWTGEEGNRVALSVEAPSELYDLEAELVRDGVRGDVLYVTVLRPSDQELFVARGEPSSISVELAVDGELPAQVTVKWRCLYAALPYDLPFDELGVVAF